MEPRVCEATRTVRGMSVTDGAGVRLTRIIGSPRLDQVDPFVLLDQFRSDNPRDYMAGFPDHPHRGIETITYMVEGRFRHRDSRGGGGLIQPGDVQWMTAGRGIVHSEMPEMGGKGEEKLWGYQLWLNLAARDKMVEPRYQGLAARDIPSVRQDGVRVVVISGSYAGVNGPARTWYPVTYLDVRLSPGATFQAPRPEGNCFLFVHTGKAYVGGAGPAAGSATGPAAGHTADTGDLVLLGSGEVVRVEAATGQPEGGFLFLSGVPHGEPVARGGPFVMNTEEEIRQAFRDYQTGRLF